MKLWIFHRLSKLKVTIFDPYLLTNFVEVACVVYFWQELDKMCTQLCHNVIERNQLSDKLWMHSIKRYVPYIDESHDSGRHSADNLIQLCLFLLHKIEHPICYRKTEKASLLFTSQVRPIDDYLD